MTHSSKLHTLGVVGAGAMGAGIAQTGLTAGLTVILFDTHAAALQNARDQIEARIVRMVEKGRVSKKVLEKLDSSLVLAEDLTAMAPAQVIIEAIIERLEPKQSLLVELEEIVDRSAVLATNTSSLSVAAIARNCKYKDRVCGLHFFNPVPLMKLVEVIGTSDTSRETFATAMELSDRLGKVAVKVRDVPGFLVNLLGRAYVTEALHIVHENVASEVLIDDLMREAAGFRMGPFELMDLTGIDVNFPATQYIYQGFQQDPRLKTTILHEAMLNAGRLGRKTGQGFHSYSDTSKASVDAEAIPKLNSHEVGMRVSIAEQNASFEKLRSESLDVCGDDANDIDAILISPVGEDAATACVRLGLQPAKVVAVDLIAIEKKVLTLMAPLGHNGVINRLAEKLRNSGYKVFVVKDSPGFVVSRILSMVANLGCEVAQIGVAESPHDIDTSMKLAQNYPHGPLEWADRLGPQRVLDTLSQLQSVTGSDRYRPSLWLRRRAILQLPIHTVDS